MRPNTHFAVASALLAGVMAVLCFGSSQTASPASATSSHGAVADKPPLKPEELDQLAAPIALYSDDLLSQVLMASTYPMEVVMADRWAKENSKLTGDALAKALADQTWDPSVKSLVNVPQVLSMMSEKLDWTVKLGDAFLANEKSVMDAVQRLRAKANAQGNLKTSAQQTVIVEPGPTQVIRIESPSPQVIYVPTYNPTVVYGAWPYPAYPPYYYYPPGYTAGVAAVSFGVGVACGMAWGYAWGGCNWHGGNVNVNVNRNVNVNNNYVNRNINNTNINRAGGAWQHDAAHRGGVAYRDSATARQYGGISSTQASQARQDYRGRTDAAADRAGTANNRANAAGDRANTANNRANTASDRAGTASNRAGGAAENRSGAASNRSQTRTSGSAFGGANGSGRSASEASNRGASSRGTSGGSRSFGGGARSGGGSRGGGGRR